MSSRGPTSSTLHFLLTRSDPDQSSPRLTTPTPTGYPVMESRRDFFRNGIYALANPATEITAHELCPFCLRGYSNDPTYHGQQQATPSQGGNTDRADRPDQPAIRIKICGHRFHRRCLERSSERKCPSCYTTLYKWSFRAFINQVSKGESLLVCGELIFFVTDSLAGA